MPLVNLYRCRGWEQIFMNRRAKSLSENNAAPQPSSRPSRKAPLRLVEKQTESASSEKARRNAAGVLLPTMKDVAREAGVSLGTVSNVLNNPRSVRPGNRERVLMAVRKLGFRSNMAAWTLKTKLSRNIGLIIPSITNPFYPELARGVEDVANKAGLTVFLCNDDRDVAKERKYIEKLIAKNADGLILVKPQVSLQEVDEIAQFITVIMVDVQAPAPSPYNIVNIEDVAGIRLGMKLLYGYSHTKIAFVTGMLESASSRSRYGAYTDFLTENGIEPRNDYVIKGNYDWNGGYSAAKKLLALSDPPTAIFAANDLMAIGVLKAVQDEGLKVPENISVMGFDNIDISNLSTPSLTTINQPKYEMGALSAEMLLGILTQAETHRRTGQSITLKTEVVYRNSVGPVNAGK